MAAGVAVALSSATAAPRDDNVTEKPKPPKLEDVLVPVPGFSPPVGDNGCHVRVSPADDSGLKPGQRRIPFWELVSDAYLGFAVQLIVNGNKGRDVFLTRIGGLSPDARTAATLFALQNHMGLDRELGEGLHTFFFLTGGALAPEIRDALAAAGMSREHQIFSEAISIFGDPYPLDNDVREKLFGYHYGPKRNRFDLRLVGVVRSFPTREELAAKIMAFIESKPAVWREIEAGRARLGVQRRVDLLAKTLGRNLVNGDFAVLDARSAPNMSEAERSLLTVEIFNQEFENGGIHQFFFNSSGNIAPDVAVALDAMGLTRQADLVRRGMAMFKAPYPRDRRLRDSTYIGVKNDEGFETGLAELTDQFYALDGGVRVTHLGNSTQIEGGPGIREGMIRFAREKGLLPC